MTDGHGQVKTFSIDEVFFCQDHRPFLPLHFTNHIETPQSTGHDVLPRLGFSSFFVQIDRSRGTIIDTTWPSLTNG